MTHIYSNLRQEYKKEILQSDYEIFKNFHSMRETVNHVLRNQQNIAYICIQRQHELTQQDVLHEDSKTSLNLRLHLKKYENCIFWRNKLKLLEMK